MSLRCGQFTVYIRLRFSPSSYNFSNQRGSLGVLVALTLDSSEYPFHLCTEAARILTAISIGGGRRGSAKEKYF